VQKSQPSSNVGVMAPWVCTPKNVALGYDVGKISEGCLVTIIIIIIIICKVTATENNHTTKQHKTKWQHKL